MEITSSKHFLKKPVFFSASVAMLLLLRVFINATLPLMDKTEARYAEIARLMAETNNYVSPHIDYGTPFWGKPPLSTWLSALCIEVFGVNEFAVRLPSLLVAILMLLMLGNIAKRNKLPFFLPGFILLTLPEFLLHAGVVSTDMSLAFCVILVLLSFWENIKSNQRTHWNYLFFLGIGLGLLAKGPIILVLTLPPIFIWTVLTKRYLQVLEAFSWLSGIFIVVLLAFPWYYFAEKATPGFLDYFIIGEHFKRFFDSGWSGDKYGFPKSQPFGMIWIFLLLFTLPWIALVLKKLWKNRRQLKNDQWLLFLTLWLLWTPFFFTFSSSLIHPYILPVMVPLALMITCWWESLASKKLYVGLAFAIPVLSTVLFVGSSITTGLKYYSKTDKYLVNDYPFKETRIYHLNKKSYSSQFYSQGNTVTITKENLGSILNTSEPIALLIAHRDTSALAPAYFQKLKKVRSNRYKGLYTQQ